MTLENIYYLFAIIVCILGIFFLLGCIAFITYLFIIVKNTKKHVSEATNQLMANAEKVSGATGLGMFIISTLLRRFKSH